MKAEAKVITGEAIRSEAESFFSEGNSPKILAHSEILGAILDALEPITFLTADKESVPQKHLLVMCVNELLAKVKEQHFDLARKNHSIFAFNGAYWKELPEEVIKDFLGKVAKKLSVHALESQHYEFKDKLYKQFLSSAYFEPIEPRSDIVLINLQNGTFEISKDSQTFWTE